MTQKPPKNETPDLFFAIALIVATAYDDADEYYADEGMPAPPLRSVHGHGQRDYTCQFE